MALWGRSDAASNSTLFALAQVGKTANSSNQTDLFGNTTASASITGAIVGQFGVDGTESRVGSGTVYTYRITFNGSGYSANAAVTLAGGGGSGASSNATANSTGRISTVNANQVGSAYETSPSVTIAAPTAKTFNANTGIAANGALTISGAGVFLADDLVTYTLAAGNTAVVGLTTGAQFYIKSSNSTAVYLASSKGGAAITPTPSTVSETGHSLTGETATAAAVVGGGQNKGVTAGWNLRTEGTGGRAGRVRNECLVAIRSMASDASDDNQLPDS
jgi:hypothetical protein